MKVRRGSRRALPFLVTIEREHGGRVVLALRDNERRTVVAVTRLTVEEARKLSQALALSAAALDPFPTMEL